MTTGRCLPGGKQLSVYLLIFYHFLRFSFVRPISPVLQERPPRVDPGGHHFVVLNSSINNTPVFVLEVVAFQRLPICYD